MVDRRRSRSCGRRPSGPVHAELSRPRAAQATMHVRSRTCGRAAVGLGCGSGVGEPAAGLVEVLGRPRWSGRWRRARARQSLRAGPRSATARPTGWHRTRARVVRAVLGFALRAGAQPDRARRPPGRRAAARRAACSEHLRRTSRADELELHARLPFRSCHRARAWPSGSHDLRDGPGAAHGDGARTRAGRRLPRLDPGACARARAWSARATQPSRRSRWRSSPKVHGTALEGSRRCIPAAEQLRGNVTGVTAVWEHPRGISDSCLER